MIKGFVTAQFIMVALLIFVVFLNLGTVTPFYVISSSSMRPALSIGDLLIVNYPLPNQLYEGDIVVFRVPMDQNSQVLAHRIVKVSESKIGTIVFNTKGDANSFQDPFDLSYSNIIGKTLYAIPKIGFVFSVFQNPYFDIVLIGALFFYFTEYKRHVK